MTSMRSGPRRRPRKSIPPFLIPVLVLAAGAASCSPTTLPATTLWAADLDPLTPAGVKGTLGAVSQAGQTRVSLTLSLGDPGATYVWRIAEGDCSAEGALVAGKAVYPTIVAGSGGGGDAEAGLAGELMSGTSYASRIALQATGGEQVVSCGKLRQTK